MEKGDSVILNWDYEDLIAGTMGVVTAVNGNVYTIAFETGQTIDLTETDWAQGLFEVCSE